MTTTALQRIKKIEKVHKTYGGRFPGPDLWHCKESEAGIKAIHWKYVTCDKCLELLPKKRSK